MDNRQNNRQNNPHREDYGYIEMNSGQRGYSGAPDHRFDMHPSYMDSTYPEDQTTSSPAQPPTAGNITLNERSQARDSSRNARNRLKKKPPVDTANQNATSHQLEDLVTPTFPMGTWNSRDNMQSRVDTSPPRPYDVNPTAYLRSYREAQTTTQELSIPPSPSTAQTNRETRGPPQENGFSATSFPPLPKSKNTDILLTPPPRNSSRNPRQTPGSPRAYRRDDPAPPIPTGGYYIDSSTYSPPPRNQRPPTPLTSNPHQNTNANTFSLSPTQGYGNQLSPITPQESYRYDAPAPGSTQSPPTNHPRPPTPLGFTSMNTSPSPQYQQPSFRGRQPQRGYFNEPERKPIAVPLAKPVPLSGRDQATSPRLENSYTSSGSANSYAYPSTYFNANSNAYEAYGSPNLAFNNEGRRGYTPSPNSSMSRAAQNQEPFITDETIPLSERVQDAPPSKRNSLFGASRPRNKKDKKNATQTSQSEFLVPSNTESHQNPSHNTNINTRKDYGPFNPEGNSLLNRMMRNLHVSQSLHWLHPKFFHPYAIFGGTYFSYQLPGRYYKILARDGSGDGDDDEVINELQLQNQNQEGRQGQGQGQNEEEDESTRKRKDLAILDNDELLEVQQDLLLSSKTQSQSQSSTLLQRKYLDVFRRKTHYKIEDRRVNPSTGQLEDLVVQATPAVYDQRNRTTWRRTYIENVSPYLIRLAYWPKSAVDIKMQQKALDAKWELEDWVGVLWRWVIACVGILVMLFIPSSVSGPIPNNGKYNPFPYRYWSYPKTPKNPLEGFPSESKSKPKARSSNSDQTNLDSSSNANPKPKSKSKSKARHNNSLELAKRVIRPRKLCFIDRKSADNPDGARTKDNPYGCLKKKEWKDADQPYLFISYTGMAFGRKCRKSDEKDHVCETCQKSDQDTEDLHRLARRATRDANLQAYWTDNNCMASLKDEPDKFSKDIYRINDVVRNAHSFAIIIGEPVTQENPEPESEPESGLDAKKTWTKEEMLTLWGDRMWTFPEVLLAPPKRDLPIYLRRIKDNEKPWILSRLALAQIAWDIDRTQARELFDHYDGNMTLSRLELVSIALGCLLTRSTGGFSEGDRAYALMGLLRQRPVVDFTDSAFQAFARLSLANDSDRLLERMICFLPRKATSEEIEEEKEKEKEEEERLKKLKKHEAKEEREKKEAIRLKDLQHYWAIEEDFWKANLWDVEPRCQIAAVGNDDTVVIDGAYAATIHWDSFQRVAMTTKETYTRMISRILVRATPALFGFGLFLRSYNQIIGIIILVLVALLVLWSPVLILHIYGGKVWSTQPWLFGFEGHMPIKEIEKMIFGFPAKRLTWTPYGSSLSEHALRRSFLKDECRGVDPYRVQGTRELIERGPCAEYGESRVFTLVDTNTMTVTLFEAERPPTVALLCGSEGGMQRAIMCSYDWPTQTLYRETVLRMETRVLEKMSMVSRVSFGLRRNVKGKPATWPKAIDTTELVNPEDFL